MGAWKKPTGPSSKTNVAVLNGENVTKESLVNLLKDTTAPVTQELIQTEAGWSLLGENVTSAHLKNLLTDKPAPITVKLAQTHGDKDIASSLLGENITRGALKNLVTDKPAPITVKLAQTGNKPIVDQLLHIEKRDPTGTIDGDTVTGMVG